MQNHNFVTGDNDEAVDNQPSQLLDLIRISIQTCDAYVQNSIPNNGRRLQLITMNRIILVRNTSKYGMTQLT
jgi:hypothetical protein